MPIIVDNIEQGSKEWHDLRLGVVTASGFSSIITPARCLPSQSAQPYMRRKLREWLTREEASTFSSEWTRRGTEMEDEARRWYQREIYASPDCVKKVGFVYLDDRKLVGCSPDALVGSFGGLEIKCPALHTQQEYLRANAVPSKYIAQIQGSMWATDRDWWDFLSYHPDTEKLLISVSRDDEYIAKLSSAVNAFVDEMMFKREQYVNRHILKG